MSLHTPLVPQSTLSTIADGSSPDATTLVPDAYDSPSPQDSLRTPTNEEISVSAAIDSSKPALLSQDIDIDMVDDTSGLPSPIYSSHASQPMHDLTIKEPPSPPSSLLSAGHIHSRPSDDEGQPSAEHHRPAKRARTDVAHPPSSSTHHQMLPTETTFSPAQHKFAFQTLRSARKQKDAFAFNQPVDPILLNIPHYPSIVTRPMDLSTVEKKLVASNPSRPDPNPRVPRYYSATEFIEDVKLIFANCYLFNGEDHLVSHNARRLEAFFERSMKNMPPPMPPTPIYKAPTPAPTPPPPAPPKKVRRPSAVPTIRRDEESNRPKREIHPPAPKDIDYAAPTNKRPRVGGKKRVKDDGTHEQLRYCLKIINDLYKKQYSTFAGYFYDPVDRRLVPSYYDIIKNPMDMSTMKQNLERGVYPHANSFYEDFQLMIGNCVKFNPVGTPVYIAGQDLQKVFHEKWRELPPLHTPEPDTDDEGGEVDSSTIRHLEDQIANIQDTINSLKKSGPRKPSGTRPPPRTSTATPVSSSTAHRLAPSSKPKASSSTKKKSSGGSASKKSAAQDEGMLTFEQKKELSEAIQNLEGEQLEVVINIIHTGVPDIGPNADEIEIEIDALPPNVLRELWNTVIQPPPPPPKPAKTKKAVGGNKRKVMDEDVEAEKIRQIQEKIAMLKGQTPASAMGGIPGGMGGVGVGVGINGADAGNESSDSDTDSGSDSSDSD